MVSPWIVLAFLGILVVSGWQTYQIGLRKGIQGSVDFLEEQGLIEFDEPEPEQV